LFLQLLTVLAEKPPASAGYRGSDLVPWPDRVITLFQDGRAAELRVERGHDPQSGSHS
jgi:hypothetical protein